MPDETADSAASLDETANSSVAVIDLEDDDSEPEILLDQSVSGFTSGRSLRSGTGGRDRWVLALQSFLLSPCRPAHAAATPALPQGAKSTEKCSTCRQHLAEVCHYSPGKGAGAEQVIAHPAVNICMDTEDDQALQYKLTDFAVYDKVSGSNWCPSSLSRCSRATRSSTWPARCSGWAARRGRRGSRWGLSVLALEAENGHVIPCSVPPAGGRLLKLVEIPVKLTAHIFNKK